MTVVLDTNVVLQARAAGHPYHVILDACSRAASRSRSARRCSSNTRRQLFQPYDRRQSQPCLLPMAQDHIVSDTGRLSRDRHNEQVVVTRIADHHYRPSLGACLAGEDECGQQNVPRRITPSQGLVLVVNAIHHSILLLQLRAGELRPFGGFRPGLQPGQQELDVVQGLGL